MARMVSRNRKIILILFAAASLMLTGCQSAYYKTVEQFGVHKRDLMTSRVKKARDAQKDAKDQFQSALERFNAVLNIKNGTLKEKYDTLNKELEKSERKAEVVHKRIKSVEDVSEDLFSEWESELKQYSNKSMRSASQKKLTDTRKKYQRLITAMKRAEKKIEPVLNVFRDQVLFLKHNLNAEAITSIQSELSAIESNVASLIGEMETSIKEADTFIKAMNK